MEFSDRTASLFNEWCQYKKLHYSNKTLFDNAIDIEIERDNVAQWAQYLVEGLSTDNVTDEELLFRITTFERMLATFKDRITMELLKNGN